MKLFLIALFTLVSSVAMADGFRCQNDGGLRVKLFNEIQPERGTRNPAILIVSERARGTLATLEGTEIEKTIDEASVTYEGQTNGTRDGRFVYVKLEVSKKAETDGDVAGMHRAVLTVNADNSSRSDLVYCERYRKSDQQ
jgi:hypothetical protein